MKKSVVEKEIGAVRLAMHGRAKNMAASERTFCFKMMLPALRKNMELSFPRDRFRENQMGRI